jgi:hypothetical protein
VSSSAEEIEREVDRTRHDIDRTIDVIEGRVQSTARRLAPVVAAAVAVGTAMLAGAYVLYRSRRKPTFRERVAALLPDRVSELGDSARRRVREGFPPTRIYIGDRLIGQEPPAGAWQKIGMRLAQSAGTAAGSAAVAYALRRMTRPEPARG